jgi:hypothetical protein
VGVQSVVSLHLYKGGGIDPLQVVSRANPAVLANKSHEKLGTLNDSAHKRTVRATTAERPAWTVHEDVFVLNRLDSGYLQQAI